MMKFINHRFHRNNDVGLFSLTGNIIKRLRDGNITSIFTNDHTKLNYIIFNERVTG